ncbi:MAG: HAD family phosphatase [Cytophagales bacterium]|nr:HAD family phosphatase [Cytophagales bacterium]
MKHNFKMADQMKAVIFDMDGTMVDNMMVHHRAWQRKLAQLGLEMDLEQVRQEIHGVNKQILQRLFGDRFTDEDRERIAWEKEEEYRKIFKDELKLIDGLDGFLEVLKSEGLPMGIGSAAPVENVDFVLDELNIRSLFKVVKHAGDVVKGKPDPEIYHKVAAGLGVDPKDCVVFEDTPTGAKSGSAAGCKVVVILNTHEKAEFDGITGIQRFIKDYHFTSLKGAIG